MLRMVRYVGSGHHKRHPADYGFGRANPRPTKSLCDARRPIALAEAQKLIASGVEKNCSDRRKKTDCPNTFGASRRMARSSRRKRIPILLANIMAICNDLHLKMVRPAFSATPWALSSRVSKQLAE
ncbi:MAG TPA: hypothetical protein VJ001_00550 [Rhodocyclaceae bacterium]|nr:hypothetical protein [Rhodocyclaceae bacterium]